MTFTTHLQDRVTPYLNGLQGVFTRGDIMMAAGQGVSNAVRDRFRLLQATRPNKQGFPRRNLWAQMLRSVSNPSRQMGGVTVNISHVAAARLYFGGDFTPRNTDYFTIPANAQAYGKRAREFGFLTFTFAMNQWGKMQPALVDMPRPEFKLGGKKKDGSRAVQPQVTRLGGVVFYWLTKHVHQNPDPSILPTEEQLRGAALAAADDFLKGKI